MIRAPRKIPLLTTVVALGMTAFGLFFSYGQFTAPTMLMPGADPADPVLRGLGFAMGSRSFAMALALLIAWLLRSPRALFAVLTMRLVTEALDLTNMVLGGRAVLAGVLIVSTMILFEAAALIQLWRLLRTEAAVPPSFVAESIDVRS